MADPPEGDDADAAQQQQQPASVEVVSDDRNSEAGQQQANFPQPMMRQPAGGMWYPPPQHPQHHYPQQQHALAYYEAQMRDHAVAYANAAAGAAWAAAQIATNPSGAPPLLPPPPSMMIGPMMPPFPPNNLQQQQMGWGPPHHHHQPEAPHAYQDDDMSELSFQSPLFAHHQPHHQESDQSSEVEQQQQPGRKRLQRASVASPPAAGTSRSSPNERHHGHKRGRRRLHSALGDSSDTSNSHRHSHKHVRHGSYSSASSAKGRHHHYKRDSMSSLLGKTGVSALYEWCDKQRVSPPVFMPQQVRQMQDIKVPEYEISAQIEGQEWGVGRGASKAGAKQDAAQKALVNLVPGAAFDDSGLLIKMPSDEVRDDLAPTLASQLAIGTSKMKKKRHWNVYPGTSTTSEEDEENTYYASRGASVCSALLHMMWQIDDRIKDPPSYVYDLVENPASTNTQLKRKGPTAGGPAVAVHRSAFRCTARLQMRNVESTNIADVDDELSTTDGMSQEQNNAAGAETDRLESDERSDAKPRAETDTSALETLLAIGTGATKREARHKASSKLLAMLFPECNGMVEVKAAAEAAREHYAARKALKQGPRNSIQHKRRKQDDSRDVPFRKRTFAVFAPDPADPPLPSYLQRELSRHFSQSKSDVGFDEVSVESLSLSDSVLVKGTTSKETGIVKGSARPDRYQQIISQLHSALHEMNELSEDGRTLSEEISENDVGVTVLRPAEPEDVKWMRSLLQKNHTPDACDLAIQGPTSSLLSCVARPTVLDAHVWKAVSITLLLCRKIAPFEDPPLGFATLTLGFSIDKGRTLRVASIVSEPHLPRERFLECLESFASLMNCELERESIGGASDSCATSEDRTERFEASELQSLLSAYLTGSSAEEELSGKHKTEESPGMLDLNSIGASLLQSVQEEDTEAEEETDTAQESTRKAKPKDKPNKRSRVA